MVAAALKRKVAARMIIFKMVIPMVIIMFPTVINNSKSVSLCARCPNSCPKIPFSCSRNIGFCKPPVVTAMVVPGSPYFIMTYDTAKKLTGITEQTGILAIKNSEGCFDEVLTAVQKIADKNEKIEVNTIEQTIKNIQHRYSASINALYMTSAILFVFGSISLMNMLMVDFQNRKREFGLLEAVGVTRKQLKAMLNREIGIYLGGSLAISLICGSIFSVIVCRRLDAINHCITLKLPWFFLLALICVLLVIYLVFSMYSKMELKKASILSAIKSE